MDESGATTKMVRPHARSPKGERACGTAPGGTYDKLAFFGAFTLSGVEAAMSVEGSANTAAVCAFAA